MRLAWRNAACGIAAVALLLPFPVAAQPADLATPPKPQPSAETRPEPALFHAAGRGIGVEVALDTLVVFKVVTFRDNAFWKATPAGLPTTRDLASDRVPVAGLRVKF